MHVKTILSRGLKKSEFLDWQCRAAFGTRIQNTEEAAGSVVVKPGVGF
jgi:DNA helicase TIP49 (TBP-interacting protein)